MQSTTLERSIHLRITCAWQGLLEFLAHAPYYMRAHWNHLLLKPLQQHGPGALPLMQLLKGVMLRRTKRHVGEQMDEH